MEQHLLMAPHMYRLDDRHITWRPFRGPAGLSFWVLSVNETRQHVDMLFRLDPFARCVPHRHVGPTTTLVVEGEHRTYAHSSGAWTIDEVRPPGTFDAHDGDSTHIEEGGPDGAIIVLSMQAVDGVIWELLDERGCVTDATTVEGFVRAWERQRAA